MTTPCTTNVHAVLIDNEEAQTTHGLLMQAEAMAHDLLREATDEAEDLGWDDPEHPNYDAWTELEGQLTDAADTAADAANMMAALAD